MDQVLIGRRTKGKQGRLEPQGKESKSPTNRKETPKRVCQESRPKVKQRYPHKD
jgi:hypothetical protein